MKSCIKRCSDDGYVWYSFSFIGARSLNIYDGKVEVSIMEKELGLGNNQMKEKQIIIFGVTSMSTDSTLYSNLLVTKMNNFAKKQHLLVHVDMHSISKLDQYAKAADVILLSPELSSMRETIIKEYPTKVIEVIDMKDYGLLNAENILKKFLHH